MSKAWLTVFLLCCTFVFGRQVPQRHRDYVPDAATAQRIAEAVLIGQYGDERVKDQLPLRVDGSNGDYWIVQGLGHGELSAKGGGPAVWIDSNPVA
jgi:hypothetical protein